MDPTDDREIIIARVEGVSENFTNVPSTSSKDASPKVFSSAPSVEATTLRPATLATTFSTVGKSELATYNKAIAPTLEGDLKFSVLKVAKSKTVVRKVISVTYSLGMLIGPA